MHAEEKLADVELSERMEIERVHHLAEVVRGTQDAVLSKDREGIITSWNPAAERLYGYSAEEAIGTHISFLVPSDHKDEEKTILARIKSGERIETYETERIRKDGARVDISLTISPIEHPTRGIVGASVIARDITAERRRRKAQEFLVAATRGLDASLDPSETARTIVRTAVPELAEMCVIDFVRQDGRLGDSVVAATDPEAAARLEAIRRRALRWTPRASTRSPRCCGTGRPMIWRDLRSEESVAQVAQNEEHRRLMDDAGYNSAAVVELVARGRTIGALSFLHVRSDLRYDASDLELLSELADRAAMALDNARLYRERDRVAANLQRGLRPPKPIEVPGLEISVVFEAAGEGVEVGGDLYDVFSCEDGCWIVVGDVAGKGIETAGVSVAMRHSVRGLTMELDEPAEVLRRVNELLLEGTSLNDFATAVLIRMRRRRRWLAGWSWRAPAIRRPSTSTKDGSAQLGGGSLLGAVERPAARAYTSGISPTGRRSCSTPTAGWRRAHGRATASRTSWRRCQPPIRTCHSSRLTDLLRRDAVARGGGSLRDDMVVLAVRPVAA